MDNGFSKTSGNGMVNGDNAPKLCPYCGWHLDMDGYCPNENCDKMKGDIDEDCNTSRGER